MKWLHILVLYFSSIFIIICFFILRSNQQKTSTENAIKLVLLFTAPALFSNATALLMPSATTASLMYGMYNGFSDCMMISLLEYAHRYTNTKAKLKYHPQLLGISAVIDIILMLSNPWTKLVFTCTQTTDIQHLQFFCISERKLLFIFHTFFISAIALRILSMLFAKFVTSSSIYKVKYGSISLIVLAVVVFHIVYICRNLIVDYSLMLYFIIDFFICYFTLFYVPRGLMERLIFFTISNIQDGIICVDIDGKCVYANKPAQIFYGCEDKSAELEKCIKELLETKIPENASIFSWDCTQLRKNVRRHYTIEYKSIYDKTSNYIGCFFLIHDRTEENNRISAEKYKATHDALTGVYNKEYFYETSGKLMRENPDTKFVIICTDVKNFKIVNDIFGVQTGDMILKSIAGSLSEIVSENCVYGRITGDRFAVCMPESNFNEQLLLDLSFKTSTVIENSLFKIHLHFGVYRVNDMNVRISVMCDRANLAIKTIKESYQTVVAYYDNSMRENFMGEQKIISEFEEALNDGQFKAYIQPQVSKDGNIYGGEALVRWAHPDGMIPPYKFIETFEQTGLISRLDSYMWELACIQINKWNVEGKENCYISVNISPKDFFLLDIYTVITSLVKKYKIKPQSLHLEITETAIMQNLSENLKLIQNLRNYGFTVEIDDFGSGYSSLNTLKDLCADVLKIDMGFLRKTENMERSKIILKMVVSLAKSLNMEVITEGVETEEHVKFLTDIGCDVFQGYYFAKPMPVEEFEEKFLNRKVKI